MVLVALLWGARGATLAAIVGALMAVTQTVRGLGPFIGQDGLFGDSVLTAQVYAVALSITGLLVATMVHGRRGAAAQARE
jgi:urea transporter